MTDWKVVTVTHLAAAAAGFIVAPREMLDRDVQQTGFFTADTKHILSATVSSLRSESKLLVYSYKTYSDVAVSRSSFFILHGSQELRVPASVNYYVDLSGLTLDRVKYDEAAQLVTVTLPPLRLGDIAFQPEQSRTINGGLLTYNQATVDELNRLNYKSARVAITKSAQDPTLLQAAERQGAEDIENYFEIPLRIVGHPDVRVMATFNRAG